jgi:hypothetical protein
MLAMRAKLLPLGFSDYQRLRNRDTECGRLSPAITISSDYDRSLAIRTEGVGHLRKAAEQGKKLEVAIALGVDPANYYGGGYTDSSGFI